MSATSEDLVQLVLEVFRLNGSLLAAGDEVVGAFGLTSARWQILGAVMRKSEGQTVAQIAREAGVTRQAVQRIANALAGEGLLVTVDNPRDRRAPLLEVTDRGRDIYRQADGARRKWLGAIAGDFAAEDLAAAVSLLRRLRGSLEAAG